MNNLQAIIKYRLENVANGALGATIVLVPLVGFFMLFTESNPEWATKWFLRPYHWIMLPTLLLVCTATVIYSFKKDHFAGLVALTSGSLYVAIGPSNAGLYYELGPIAALSIVLTVMQYLTNKKPAQAKVLATTNSEENEQEADVEAIQFRAVRSNVNFHNIIGMTELKQRLIEAAREITAKQSPNAKKKARNGVLLYGEPGNGKTFFAEALAGELKLPLISVSNSDLASRFINNTTEKVSKLFADARAQAPCVLFIDEIDSLITSRDGSGSGYEEGPRITNAILTELVDMRDHKVVILAATNFLDKLDAAAIREGRFDFKVEVTAPDKEARAGLIKSSMKDFPDTTLVPVAIEQAATRWEGFSVARIRAVIEEAGRQASKDKQIVVDYSALQLAMRTIQGNQGDRIPENTPGVEDLTMDSVQRSKLLGIAHRMENIEEIEALGGSVPTGVLFYGPPGTGKTLTARALAKTTGWAMITVSGSDLMASTDAIDKLVIRAKNIRPVIVFIDEADDVLSHRRGAGSVATITNKLLAAIDGAKGKAPDIVWVAATNHPDQMDEAALRGGRFTEKIEFREADIDGATAMVQRWMKETKAALDSTMTADHVAQLLDGESPANIKAVLQQAINNMIERRASRGEESVVTISDVITAKEIVLGV